MDERCLLTADELAGLLKISKRQLWRLRDCGALPAPDTIGGAPRCLRWRKQIVLAYIQAGMPDCRRTGWKPSGGAGRGACGGNGHE